MPRVPRLLSGPSVRSLNLPPAEAYLLSRVDGVLSEDDLAFVTGMAPEDAAVVLDRLAALGAVEFSRGAPAWVDPGPAEAPTAGAPLYDPAELEELVELELDKKRRVLDLYYRLDELTYYDLLGVADDADKKAVKSAYYAIAPEFHPDKFFRKQLGSFKPKIEAIFGRFTLAHDVLTVPQRRAEYDEYLVQTQRNRKTSAVLEQQAQDVQAILAAVEQAAAQALAAQQAAAQQARGPVSPGFAAPGGGPAAPLRPAPTGTTDQEVLRQRREALARKLMGGGRRPAPGAPAPTPQPAAEMDPVFAERAAEALRVRHEAALAEAKQAQITRYLDAGRAAMEGQDYAAAANSYRIASSLSPEDAAVQATCNDALQKVAAALADGYWKQALYEEGQERWAEAALSYSKVCAGRPDSAHAHERVAHATVKSSGNSRRAVEFARRAIELDPKKPEYHVTLSRAYFAASLERSAQSELDRALELAPKDPRVQALVSSARASFVAKPEAQAPPAENAGKAGSVKASGFHSLVAAVRSAIAPKEGK